MASTAWSNSSSTSCHQLGSESRGTDGVFGTEESFDSEATPAPRQHSHGRLVLY